MKKLIVICLMVITCTISFANFSFSPTMNNFKIISRTTRAEEQMLGFRATVIQVLNDKFLIIEKLGIGKNNESISVSISVTKF